MAKATPYIVKKETRYGIEKKSIWIILYGGGKYGILIIGSIVPFTGLPTYTTTFSFPQIKGKLNEYFYIATGYSVEIKIEKQSDLAMRVHMPVN